MPGVKIKAVEVDAQRHQHTQLHMPIWMGFDDLKHIVGCRYTM